MQFVLTAEQEKDQTGQPLPIGKPGTPVFIVSGSQPGSQVPYSGTTATTTPVDGGSVVPPSGTTSYSVFSAVGGLLNVIGGACQAAVGVNVVIAASAATVATEGPRRRSRFLSPSVARWSSSMDSTRCGRG